MCVVPSWSRGAAQTDHLEVKGWFIQLQELLYSTPPPFPMIHKVKKNASSPVKPVPVKGFLNSQIVFGAPYVCNNAPSLSINRTTIVECCGAQTAELLLVTAVLHLPQPDTRAALEHHFLSAGGETELPQQTANWCGLRGELQFIVVVCFRNWAPALFDFCRLNFVIDM